MKNLLKRVMSIAAATALLMTSVISASAHNHRESDKPITVEPDDVKYTITLTTPANDVTVDAGAAYGAYQIFTGAVPSEGEAGYPADGNAFTNPGNDATKLPITDIKWGNAFGKVGETDWQDNIVNFVKALAAPYKGEASEYASAFANFNGFESFVNGANLADDFYVESGNYSNTNVNFDKLATKVAEEIAKHPDHEWLQAFADILGGYGKDYSSTGIVTNNKGFVKRYYGSSKKGDNYEIKVPESGYYMILDRTDIEAEGKAYSARMLFVVNNITQVLKEDVPTLEKKIVRDDTTKTEKDTTVAGVGDEVTFKLTGTLPSNYGAYTLGYQYTFIDTLSKGLTPCTQDNVKITVKGVYEKGTDTWNDTTEFTIDATSFEKDTTHAHITDSAYTCNVTGQNLEVKFPCLREVVISGADGKKYVLGYNFKAEEGHIKSSQIYVTYTATVNENAVVDPASTGAGAAKDLKGNKNTAQLEYSDNPQAYNDVDKTTEQIVTVYTFGLDITKIDAAAFIKEKKPDISLSGAKFAILRKVEGSVNGYEYAKVTIVDGHYAIDTWSNADPDKITITGTDGKTLRKALNDAKATGFEMETDTTGKFQIYGLDAGVEYTLLETTTPKSPDGEAYAFIDPIKFTIKAEEASGEYTGNIESVDEAAGFSKDGEVSLSQSVVNHETNAGNKGIEDFTVVNFKYTDLPSTGGIGVYIYYIAGGCVVALALVLFALSKKKKTTK